MFMLKKSADIPNLDRPTQKKKLWRQCCLLVLISSMGYTVPGAAVAKDFYLRAGIGFDRLAQTQFTDKDCSSVSPDPLYGCDRGGDGMPLRSLGNFSTATGLELGLGYTITPAVRIEALIEYHLRFAFNGHANYLAPTRLQSVSADMSSLSGILAAYVDLPQPGSPMLGPFRPFIGGGIGASRIRIGKTRMTFPKTTTTIPGASRTDLSWMLTAGFGVSLDKRTTLDLAWRYTDYGIVETGKGRGRIDWRDGSQEPKVLDLAPTWARVRGHGVRLSLRYAF